MIKFTSKLIAKVNLKHVFRCSIQDRVSKMYQNTFVFVITLSLWISASAFNIDIATSSKTLRSPIVDVYVREAAGQAPPSYFGYNIRMENGDR